MKHSQLVTNKEAYFLSLIGLIPNRFREMTLPILETKFSDEIKKFKDDVQVQTKLIK